ncbi:TetR/AcrR family transcriptional regulator [Leucobacter sp. HY1910]
MNELSTRDSILDVAAKLFTERGYAAAPLSAIAHEVGITKASLYYHFPSKESIMEALVNPLLDEVDALLAQTPPQFDDATARWQFMLRYIDVLRADPRGVAALSRRPWAADSSSVHDRVLYHRDRTIELATPPAASDAQRVRALLGMDLIHRELIMFETERPLLGDIPIANRQEIALDVARSLIQGDLSPA